MTKIEEGTRGVASGTPERKEEGTREDLTTGETEKIETGQEKTEERVHMAEVLPPRDGHLTKVQAWCLMRMTQRAREEMEATSPDPGKEI